MIHEEKILTHVISSIGANQAYELRWVYDESDPLAVTIDIGPKTRWTFARDLLAEALITPDGPTYGEGDVQIQTDGEWVRIFLTSPAGTAQLRSIKMDLINFVDATVKIVGPDEAETKIVEGEIDDALAMILSEGV